MNISDRNTDTSGIAREALAECGIPHERLARLRGGIVNDVWRAGRDAVVRVAVRGDPADLARAGATLQAITGQVRAPRLLLLEFERWAFPVMVCTYVTGRPMARSWAGWDSATRDQAITQVLREFAQLHGVVAPAALQELPVWRDRRVAAIEHMLESWSGSGKDPRLAQRLQALWREVHAHLPADDLCVIHGDFNGGNVVFSGQDLNGIIDFDDARLAPRPLDFWCMATELAEPPFELRPADVRARLAPWYRFDGQAKAWLAEQLYWTLRGLVDPFPWDDSDDPVGDAWGDVTAYFDNPGFLREWFD